MWCHHWERKKSEFHAEHFTDTSSWRANLCHWFFWPSPVSVLSLTNQIQLKPLTASCFSNLKPLWSMLLRFLLYFWHHLTYKHQSSQLCARILTALWPERSLTRIWSFHEALLMEILITCQMEQVSDSYKTLAWCNISVETRQHGAWQHVAAVLHIEGVGRPLPLPTATVLQFLCPAC